MAGGLAFLSIPHVTDKAMLFLPAIGTGLAWGSIMGNPYVILSNAIPPQRTGVYMGIFNMMIVIPMILQTLTFGFISKNFLNNDAGQAIIFGGVLLLIAAIATLRIKENKSIDPSAAPVSVGH